MKELLKQIKIAHDGKDEKIEVKYRRGFHYWDQLLDTGYVQYQSARYVISKHKLLNWLLLKIKYI